MKLSITLSALLSSIVLFQGCSNGTTEETSTPATSTTTVISGTTTRLSSPLNSAQKAVVCLDKNVNDSCDEDEPQTYTNASGEYELSVDGSVEDGEILLVTGGLNLLPTDANITLSKVYMSEEGAQNINAMSTVIADDLQQNPNHTYHDSLAQSAAEYNFSTDTMLSNPIENANNILGDGRAYATAVSAMEIILNGRHHSSAQRSALRATAAETNTTTEAAPTGDELNSVINEYSTMFNDYFTSVSEYFSSLATDLEDWYNSIVSGEEAGGTTPPVVTPPVEDVVTIEITRALLDGVWYIIDQSGDKTCSLIASNGYMSVTEADGTTTELTMTYDNTRKSMQLSVGWITADTIMLTEYRSDGTFDGYYSSDNETLTGEKMDSLAVCKSEKLGL